MNTEKFDGFRALNELELFSGRYHQLRVHMIALDLLLEGHLFYLEVLRGPGALEYLTQPLQSLAHRIAFFDQRPVPSGCSIASAVFALDAAKLSQFKIQVR